MFNGCTQETMTWNRNFKIKTNLAKLMNLS